MYLPKIQSTTFFQAIMIIGFLTIGCRNKSENNIAFGWESRLISARLPMNCSENNLAIYNENESYRLRKDEYELVLPADKIIGKDEFTFRIKIKDLKFFKNFTLARVSFCLNNKAYFGRGSEFGSSSLPPTCDFYYFLDKNNHIKYYYENEIICLSTKFLTPECKIS